MNFKLAGKVTSILLSALFLFPNMAIANLDSNGFLECDRDSVTDTRYCGEITLLPSRYKIT